MLRINRLCLFLCDPEAGSFSAVCPELPGCASAGETEEEAQQNIEEAIRLYLAPAENRGNDWVARYASPESRSSHRDWMPHSVVQRPDFSNSV
jgi:predicted RNase H-like HicB family nuclease